MPFPPSTDELLKRAALGAGKSVAGAPAAVTVAPAAVTVAPAAPAAVAVVPTTVPTAVPAVTGAPPVATLAPALSFGAPRLGDPIAVVVFCFNRPQNLERTLHSIMKVKPQLGFPLFVSQDGNLDAVQRVIAKFPQATRFQYDFKGIKITPPQISGPQYLPYHKIASHYEFALRLLFDSGQYGKFTRVLILEDDMEVAPDFFSYFRAASELLERDPTLMCASAWNDNGQGRYVADPGRFYRTECFPGLGWMLTKTLWDELAPKWPGGFWDDWLREPQQRRDRACIRPEISRVFTFGEQGASGGQFYSEHLSKIKLNDKPLTLVQMLSIMPNLVKDHYDADLKRAILAAREAPPNEIVRTVQTNAPLPSDLRWGYPTLETVTSAVLSPLGLMVDHKAGVPRTGYLGVVTFSHGAHRVFLYPASLQLK